MKKLKLYNSGDFSRRSGIAGKSKKDGPRSPFQKDYSRLLHAPSFRRLQGKTQLFPGSDSDFFRNRLTHSLEVAQIATGIADVLNFALAKNGYEKIDRDLVQFAAIAHDLGHPPFGHNGEHALEELMREHGGFEGNAQTLRILSCVEKKFVKKDGDFTSEYGLDLTYRALASVLKYDEVIPHEKSVSQGLAKGYYGCEKDLVAEIKKHVAPGLKEGKEFKTIECWIMDIADDVAYSTYDLEDSLHAGFVTPLSLLNSLFNDIKVKESVLNKTNEALSKSGYEKLDAMGLWKVAVNLLKPPQNGADIEKTNDPKIDAAMQSVSVNMADKSFAKSNLLRTQFTAQRVGDLLQDFNIFYNSKFPALSKVQLGRDALIQVEIFKHLNYELVIRSPKLAIVQYRGKDIVKKIFNAIIDSDGAFLSGRWKDEYAAAVDSVSGSKSLKYRVVCDFVAGMTDRYAVEFYDALFGEGKALYGPV